MKTKLLLFICLLMAVVSSKAQDENLKMKFDFNNVSGTSVKDDVSGITATVMSSAKVMNMGKYKVLDLGNGTGYLNMTAAAGKVFSQNDDFTISVYYRVDEAASLSGNGFFLWSFSTSDNVSATAGKYSAYRLNAQRFASSTGGYQNETGIEKGAASDKGRWMHVAYTEQSGKGMLYVDGKLIGTKSGMHKNSTNFGAIAINHCWLGRAPFASDKYLTQTLVADFRYYSGGMTAEQIGTLAKKTEELEYEMTNGGGGNNASLLKTIGDAEQLLTATADYPVGAVVQLQDALIIAKGIAESEGSQISYDNCEKELKNAIAVFKAAKGVVFDVSGITDVYDTERGFRHPGGLHTQADFDRIKRQLAEGNPTVTQAYNVLKNAEYAQSGIATYPVETIVRGGGSGENYINAARGATMAYQNALRWKIDGTKSNAAAAVRILMQWANTCKLVSGDSNWALAAGLYGYEFAQAAELVRDYEGWSREDFEKFKKWMLTVWYPGNINFLRGRNGTWENYVGGQGGIRPGHYWSNWPLCNALAVISIGILCDDVFIYNQGMSFMKYDQVGTFQDPRTANPILSDGCTEFIGNLVVTTSESPLETGAYGKLGQMQESGRDGGHAAMALGLAVDICKVAWNQGDDLFSYMDNRMAAGIEFVAACTQNVQGLPWTNYKYVDCRTAWHNGWLMSGPAEPAEVRNYWGTVIGHYEGVKGVKMPFAERAYAQMTAGGPDGGGMGGTSGGYDHLGYSVLMNTYDTQLCPEDKRPTLLRPLMEYDGKTIAHNELGGLKNTYVVASTGCLSAGKTIKLMPQLPDGEEDTGKWQWNTGETSKDISVSSDKSFIYRATYTNKNGIQSEQAFTIAAEGDCAPSNTTFSIYDGDKWLGDTVATVFYGSQVTLNAGDAAGWNPQVAWSNGQRGHQISSGPIASDRTIQAIVTSQGGRRQLINYHISVRYLQPRVILNGVELSDTTRLIVKSGDKVVLQPYVPNAITGVTYLWSDGSTAATLDLGAIENSGVYTVSININGKTENVVYEVFVKGSETALPITPGYYMLYHVNSNRYLTGNGYQQAVTFELGDSLNPQRNQIWKIERNNANKHSLISLADSLALSTAGTTITIAAKMFLFEEAKGINRYAMRSTIGATTEYWTVDGNGNLSVGDYSTLTDYPFLLIPISETLGIEGIESSSDNHASSPVYDLSGKQVKGTQLPRNGIFIQKGKKFVGK